MGLGPLATLELHADANAVSLTRVATHTLNYGHLIPAHEPRSAGWQIEIANPSTGLCEVDPIGWTETGVT
jgi:hypothetical protein